MKEYKGHLSISRPHGKGINYIAIELEDDSSGCIVVEIRVDPARFAEALTGLSHVDCQFNLYEQAPVGMIPEYKTMLIPHPKTYIKPEDREAVAASLLAPYEVDGWKGRAANLFNHHHQRGGKAEVTFVRYIDPPSAGERGGKSE